ncbi:MAG: helix-turn-helix transcriptional regulator, partial [Chloroflexota bacterium]
MQILKTKLFIPAAQQSNVPRPRLVERLNGGLARKLTLLSAPAGFGKTTLLSDWARQAGRPVAWLSLAREDDDPIRFWSYFIAAVQTIHPGLCETVQAALQASQVPPLDAVATAVINELTGLSKPFILVLDDYHSIQSDAIHNSIDYLIDHLPAQLHLVIVTREDPPLSLSRRRGRAEVSELRAVELRFTIDEVSQFLNAVAGLGLTYEEIAALDDRTEGWAVGLQMAALSMRPLDLAGKHEFIVAFSGNDRYIVDYLVEEVLHRQPHQVQSFLLQTSILERMCGALCDAVTTGQGDEPRQQSGATATFSGGQEILEYLEHNNLFLVSLDTERRWYRYHHLFADLLKRRLLITSTPQAVRSLYCKASEWFEQAGLIDEAVAHAFASQDFAITASLIERNVLETFYRSETLLVHNWLKALPEEIINTRPLLCAVYASTHMLISTREENTADTWTLTETWLQRAETALLAHSESHPQGDPFD